MKFTFEFIRIFRQILVLTAPLWLFLLSVIFILGIMISFAEDLPLGQALYFACITSTTVGYGDITPVSTAGQLISIILAGIGLITTGILVAMAVQAVRYAFDQTTPKQRD